MIKRHREGLTPSKHTSSALNRLPGGDFIFLTRSGEKMAGESFLLNPLLAVHTGVVQHLVLSFPMKLSLFVFTAWIT